MTYYYYIAADIELTKESLKNVHLDIDESEERIKGFDFPIQLEIYNGINREREAIILLDYILKQAEGHKRCTFQIANLVNSNRVPFKILERRQVQLHKIKSPAELILEEGHLLTIRKVNLVY
ncbi:hypothetical protein [Planococcus sp. CAU13]|uniref:hypothetical protein n=1 Tax=Planococcus sp. CAU13 TaxID=1541197 RepID=UPI00052FE9CB|nr:hypothetical protein [Planococcus sp. CAU13]